MNRKLRTIAGALVILIPVAIGVSRDAILRKLAANLQIQQLQATQTTSPSCAQALCSQTTRFEIPLKAWQGYSHPSIGYYGAQLDSYIMLGEKAIDPVSRQDELKYTVSAPSSSV